MATTILFTCPQVCQHHWVLGTHPLLQRWTWVRYVLPKNVQQCSWCCKYSWISLFQFSEPILIAMTVLLLLDKMTVLSNSVLLKVERHHWLTWYKFSWCQPPRWLYQDIQIGWYGWYDMMPPTSKLSISSSIPPLKNLPSPFRFGVIWPTVSQTNLRHTNHESPQ